MRQLLPRYVADLDQDALVEAYRYPVDRPWVRANMVSSLDGSAVKNGRSGPLSGAADEHVFGVLRGLADVVLVGAGTARTEGYRALRAKPAYAAHRAPLQQRPAAVLAVVSGRLDLDPDAPLFHGGPERTVVITHEASNARARDRLAEVADVVLAGADRVDLGRALDELARRGLTRVLCEGGPTLLADLVAAARLDELCLTLSPQVVGGDGTRIVAGTVHPDAAFRLAHLIESDGELLCRWTAV